MATIRRVLVFAKDLMTSFTLSGENPNSWSNPSVKAARCDCIWWLHMGPKIRPVSI